MPDIAYNTMATHGYTRHRVKPAEFPKWVLLVHCTGPITQLQGFSDSLLTTLFKLILSSFQDQAKWNNFTYIYTYINISVDIKTSKNKG